MARPDWSRKLPQPLKIPSVGILTTLGDIRKLFKHLPDECRQRDTWQHVALCVAGAALGGSIDDAVIALRLVLMLEDVLCLPQ